LELSDTNVSFIPFSIYIKGLFLKKGKLLTSSISRTLHLNAQTN